MSRESLVNRVLNPLLTDLPPKFAEFRPHQIRAVSEVISAFEDVDVVVLDAPTGSGKTIIGESVRRMMQVSSSMYVCHSKSLQDQFLDDFPYAAVIKGRSNYPTERYPDRFVSDDWREKLSCDDCTWTAEDGCEWCTAKVQCPYEIAKSTALHSPLVVANTAYFLSECNYIGRLSGRELVIADEADTLESALMGFVSVEVTRRRREKYGWAPPDRVTVEGSWREWVDEKLPVVVKLLGEESRRLGRAQKGSKAAIVGGREVRYLEGLAGSLRAVQAGLMPGQDGRAAEPWVYTGEGGQRDKREGAKAVSFKPSRVDRLGNKLLWKHGRKWLLMSATVISAAEMLDSLGYDGEYRLVKVPSTFPVENRRVYPVMIADMSRKAGDGEKAKMAAALVKVCERHPNDRILVHAVSYEVTRALAEAVRKTTNRPVIWHTDARGKEAALSEYLRLKDAVLISPSMDRGVDLPGDLCRVQVICKVPFPNLGDRQISARLHSPGGQTWYSVQTVRTIVQMTGRAVRSSTDHATTYILDANFQKMVWSRNRGLLPSWWNEAVDWREGERVKGAVK